MEEGGEVRGEGGKGEFCPHLEEEEEEEEEEVMCVPKVY